MALSTPKQNLFLQVRTMPQNSLSFHEHHPGLTRLEAGQCSLASIQLIIQNPDGSGQQIKRKMEDILSRTAWTLTCSSSALALAA